MEEGNLSKKKSVDDILSDSELYINSQSGELKFLEGISNDFDVEDFDCLQGLN